MAAVPMRRTSQRQLRRPPSRTTATRSEAQAALAAQAKHQSNQYEDDSSEDEIPVPMKLSALTKALLNDGGDHEAASDVRAPPSPPRTRRQASAAAASGPAAATRRTTRATASQPHDAAERNSSPLRELSPGRKRVVRLSNTPQSLSQMGSSTSKRRSTSGSRSQQVGRPGSGSRHDSADGTQDQQQHPEAGVNTPPAQGRVVRIVTSSSGNRSRLGSSGPSSGRSYLDRSVIDRSAVDAEAPEHLEAPDTAARNAAIGNTSVSRYPSTRSREDNPNPQGSMRIKRVGKLSGSFLSGPARRGRRRQSEEEGGFGEMGSSQEPESLAQEEPGQAPYYPDFNSGSPVGGSAVRGSHRRAGSKVEIRADSAKPSPLPEEGRGARPAEPSRIGDIGHLVSVGRLQMPATNDKENEIPFHQKWAKSSIGADKPAMAPPRIDIAIDRAASPDRKPLTAIARNTTPHRAAPAPPPKMSVLEAATSTAGAAVTTQTKQRRNILKVNNKVYTRLECLGRGGSGKVYRVMAENGTMMALKRVSLENADESTINGYLGEIDLLRKLTGVDRVVNLFDSEMNHEKQMLSLVMEMGERALDKVLQTHQSAESARLDPVFIRFYWKEMLECVQSVHNHDIVHSDLKPANFVLVQGRLKLIDFGIANAIQTDETVNVHRETQIGTPNYMSPESLMDSNSARGHRVPGRPKLMKLGKPSDIWSLGCILYQMVYGVPPFGHIVNQMARCQAIINWDHTIEFPTRATGGFLVPPSLIRTMRRCLIRDQHMRPTCEELLHYSDPFLYPAEISDKALPIDEELLARIIQSVAMKCRERAPTDSEASSVWPRAYWEGIRKAMIGKM
ncbi:Serine/threonine-protein kinase domain protein [Cordyceps fumosorosea ARSEF 2679]|uniref:Serine/threonine-protein kinase domain protein n=1 Tax=Cordyceps fumosorosea (strain ARSEF 2679) TaxID=1081104 RepID=A0A167XGD6_CORFA|nr:Serine/threonine-protein kinase domain protein [Cordyceps fumosorosea ARSEF 2679]OAA64949.1 Serine/threonine-protein kinase domain protein [Cordyceps fumosorosea ARSEF 2679]